ncbi:MAG TPA: hypothetical protein VI895_12310 [Bdellovibrionota bacterium]|nr:hypothetical protein [Bdellovibrionota bacterium]
MRGVTRTCQTVLAAAFFMLGSGCVDESKIDTTNDLMSQNLDEMRQLNRNFVLASDKVEALGHPIADMAKQFRSLSEMFARRDESFNSFVETGTIASLKLLTLVQDLSPKDIQEWKRELGRLSAEAKDFNREFAARGGEMAQFFQSVKYAAGVGQYVAGLAAKVGLLEPRDAEDLSDILADAFEGGKTVNGATIKSGYQLRIKMADELAKLNASGAHPANLASVLSRVDRVVGKVEANTTTVDRLAKLLPNVEGVLKQAAELKTASDGVVAALPELRDLIVDIRKSPLGWVINDKDDKTRLKL